MKKEYNVNLIFNEKKNTDIMENLIKKLSNIYVNRILNKTYKSTNNKIKSNV